jgi:general secretion pathway protein D
MLPITAITAEPTKATLNLKNAELRSVIETVSRLTGKTFVLDQRVNRNTKITVISQHMMTEGEIYAVFLSILKVNGMTAVTTGPVTKIMQEQQAKQDSTPISADESNIPDSDLLITQVIKLNNIAVGEVQIMLRPLIRAQGQLGVYKPSNVIVITDYAANVKKLVKLIRQVDKESVQEIELIPLEHASATEIVRILDTLNKRSAGSKAKEANESKFVADERTNSILLSAAPSDRLRLISLIKKLDTSEGQSGNTKVIYLHYAKADDIVDVLEGVGKIKEDEENQKKGGATTSRRSAGGVSYSINSHDETNSLVITAPTDLMRSFEDVIRRLDIRRAQVHVEAIIVEISENRAKELGVQWLFGSQGSGTAPAGVISFGNTGTPIGAIAGAGQANRGQDTTTTTVVDPDTGVITETSNPNQGDNGAALAQVLGGLSGIGIGAARFAESGLSFATFVNALASDTDANILSTPSLTTLDNEEADMIVGQEIPIITGSQLGSNNANPFQSIDRKEVGIKLKIKPQINEGNVIRLTINQEVSSISGATAADVVTNTRKINTNVLVEDGNMIVLGGLIDEQIQVSNQKVPFLGDIPLLGNLFKSQGTTKVKRNLMVFIHPTIVRSSHDMTSLSRGKYNYMHALQLDQQSKGIPLMPSIESPLLEEWNDSMALPPSFEDVARKRREELTSEENE